MHSQSAVGEQYVALLPRNGTAPPLKDGDVIPLADTIGAAGHQLSARPPRTRGLQASRTTTSRPSSTSPTRAVGGLGPELSRLVKGSTELAIDARKNLDSLTTLIDQSQPVLDSQTETSDAIQAWACAPGHGHRCSCRPRRRGAPASWTRAARRADEARQLFDRLQPTLPVVLANLVSVGEVALAYHANLEQMLVLLPAGHRAQAQAGLWPTSNTKQDYKGAYLSFNLNLNLPPPCTTGFLPAQQQRVPQLRGLPGPPAGDLYCRVPQDSPFNVRGATQHPVPDRARQARADGQDVRERRAVRAAQRRLQLEGRPERHPVRAKTSPAAAGHRRRPRCATARCGAPAPPPMAVAEYDPATGTYIGPDGKVYTQSDLAQTAPEEQDMADDADSARELTMVLPDEVPTTTRSPRSTIDRSTADDGGQRRAGLGSSRSPAMSVGRAMLLGLGGLGVSRAVLVGWLGCRAYQSHQEHACKVSFSRPPSKGRST